MFEVAVWFAVGISLESLNVVCDIEPRYQNIVYEHYSHNHVYSTQHYRIVSWDFGKLYMLGSHQEIGAELCCSHQVVWTFELKFLVPMQREIHQRFVGVLSSKNHVARKADLLLERQKALLKQMLCVYNKLHLFANMNMNFSRRA